MAELGKRISEKRKREGLSLREAGASAKVAFSTLGRIENGAVPSWDIGQRIESWLRGEEPQLPPPPMTLRDWFAGQIVTGHMRECRVSIREDSAARTAKLAYQLADAMLAERRKNDG